MRLRARLPRDFAHHRASLRALKEHGRHCALCPFVQNVRGLDPIQKDPTDFIIMHLLLYSRISILVSDIHTEPHKYKYCILHLPEVL